MSEDWQTDLIEAELLKAGPEGLSKEELQQAVGMGASDLRAAILLAEEDGVLATNGDRYVSGPAAGAAGPDETAAEDAPPAAEEDEEPGEAPAPAGGGSEPPTDTGAPSFRARLVIDVTYQVDPGDPQTREQAVKDAYAVLDVAERGIQAEYAVATSGLVSTVSLLHEEPIYP